MFQSQFVIVPPSGFVIIDWSKNSVLNPTHTVSTIVNIVVGKQYTIISVPGFVVSTPPKISVTIKVTV